MLCSNLRYKCEEFCRRLPSHKYCLQRLSYCSCPYNSVFYLGGSSSIQYIVTADRQLAPERPEFAQAHQCWPQSSPNDRDMNDVRKPWEHNSAALIAASYTITQCGGSRANVLAQALSLSRTAGVMERSTDCNPTARLRREIVTAGGRYRDAAHKGKGGNRTGSIGPKAEGGLPLQFQLR